MNRMKILSFLICSSLVGSTLPMLGVRAEVCQEREVQKGEKTGSDIGEMSEAEVSAEAGCVSLLEDCVVDIGQETPLTGTLSNYLPNETGNQENNWEESGLLQGNFSGTLLMYENEDGDSALEEESVKSNVDFIVNAVNAAAIQEVPDMESQVMQDFLAASNAYDQLDDAAKAEISPETEADLQLIRSRIQEVIRTCSLVTASSNEWCAKTNVEAGTNEEEIIKLAKELYPSCSPKIIYHKNVYYTDIRSGNPYRQMGMISLTFPKPEEYRQLINPKVFTLSEGELRDLSPAEDEQGNFFVERARTVSNIVIVDLPIALTGITLNHTKASVNAGQNITLKAAAVPVNATEKYELTWKSSNSKVATVNKNGVVKGVKNGTATITVSVKGQSQFKAKCKVSVVQGAHSLNPSVSTVMKETKAYMLHINKSPTIGSEWFVLGLARSGMSLKDDYFSTYYNHFANYLEENKGVLTDTVKYTEYSKAILTMTAIGKDARNVAGYNLFKPLADFDTVIAQGINGPVWALLALNSNPKYTIPKVSKVKTQTTEQRLVDYIVSQETPNGGWNMLGDYPDSDMTGMAIQALAPYYQKRGYEEVTAAIDRALVALNTRQNASGGFSTMGVETSESCSQVITALCALGINPKKDERFVKGGYWTVENLLTYHISGSGFMHVKAGSGNNVGGVAGEVNGMATEQAYYALTAYQRLVNGQSSLYDMSDLSVKKGDKGDGKGTGLEVSPIPSVKPKGQGTSLNRSNKAAGSGASLRKSNDTSLSSKNSASSTESSRKKSSRKNAKKKPEGWDFEAEEYDGGSDNWDEDIEGFEEATAAISAGEKKSEPAVPPAAWLGAGVCLGMTGTGGGVLLRRRFLCKKKGGKK